MNLVTIGQFSQMTRLSTKALRLYDQNGLIPPAHIDPSSGYRYYDLTQANRAEAVRILRSIDMPLDEIKTVLDAEDNPEMIHKLLGMHRERLVDRLAADERMLRYLESLMERKDGIMPYTVEIDEVEPRPVAAIRLRTSISKVGRDVGAAFGRLIAELGQAGIEPAGPPLTVHHEIIDNETDGDIEVCIQITGDFEGRDDLDVREIEGGPVAATTHKGRYHEITPAYHTLTGWIAEHGHEIVGPPREIYLNDPQIVLPEDLLTRVEFPIKPSPS